MVRHGEAAPKAEDGRRADCSRVPVTCGAGLDLELSGEASAEPAIPSESAVAVAMTAIALNFMVSSRTRFPRPGPLTQPRGATTIVEAEPGGPQSGETVIWAAKGGPVRHAARAAVELTLRRPGQRELTLTGGRGADEFGTSHGVPGIVPQPLPGG